MKHCPPSKKEVSGESARRQGFALVITLSLISFVFLLVITLIGQIRLDLSYSDVRQSQILAKAHARMGMMVAIGEIQKHLGPDMRVSTTADIYDERIDSGKKYYPEDAKIEYGFDPNNPTQTFLHRQRTAYPSDETNVINEYPTDSLEAVDLYENSKIERLPLGQRQWTGVWKHRGHGSDNYLASEGFSPLATRDLPFNSDKGSFISDTWLVDTSYDHHPAVEQAWLVSGNEGWQQKLGIVNNLGQLTDFIEVPDGKYIDDEGLRVIPGSPGGNYGKKENPWVDHEEVVLKMSESNAYRHPLVPLPDPSGPENNFNGSDQTTWILKTPVLNENFDQNISDHVKNWKSYLAAEPVKVRKTALYSHNDPRDEDPEEDWNKRSGSYAYWVGDEGVKAKINIMEPFELNGDTMDDLLDEPSHLMVAAEPNLQKGSFGFDFTPGAKTDDEQRKDLIVQQSVKDLLEEDKGTDAIAANYFYHSMTTDSFGVLADVRTGGLKRDLSLAFLEDEKSELWKKDFNNNWIYRDRVEALKNFPIFAEQSKSAFATDEIHKNQWFDSASDATVEDSDAMLAGPQWSVLADFHKLCDTSADLKMNAPSTFPRVVGDNALIFNPGESPRSPAVAMPKTADDRTYRFFNSFTDKYGNSVRPEPTNHSIAPILTGLKMSFNPVISNSNNEIEIAINAVVTLWNPYNKPMRVENLFAYMPLASSNLHIMELDLREYDLFRKWWMFVSKEIEPPQINSLGVKERDPAQPWPLYAFHTGEITALGKPQMFYGIFHSLMQPGGAGSSSIGGSSNTDGFLFEHQFPRNPDDFWMSNFQFKTIKKKAFPFNSLSLNLFNNKPDHLGEAGLNGVTILRPGEVVSFSNTDEISGDMIPNPVINLEARGSETGAFLGKTGITDFKFGAVGIDFRGFSGINNTTSDNLEVAKGGGFQYSGNKKPNCVSLYIWKGSTSFIKDNPLANLIYSMPLDLSDDIHAGQRDKLRIYTKGILSKIWTERDQVSSLPGIGWNLEFIFPGDRKNERVLLNDFNVRHLVHSEQQGMGSWLHRRGKKASINGYESKLGMWTESLKHLQFDASKTSYSVYHPDFIFNQTKDSNYTNKFNTPDNYSLTVGGTATKHALGLEDMAFPDIYNMPTSFYEQVDWDSLKNKLEDKDTPDTFAQTLFDDPSIDTSAIITDPDYPDSLLKSFYRAPNYIPEDLKNGGVPKWEQDEARVGFFRNDSDYNLLGSPPSLSSKQSNQEADSNAVLFDIPDSQPLSILQYRHANLNSYLHGPSYALGNSYASTQVARHRSWGRVQTIQHEPTSQRGLTSSLIREMDEKQNIWLEDYNTKFKPINEKDDHSFHNWGKRGKQAFRQGGEIQHNIDLNEGFAAWRKNDSGSQFNHQNTTVDHSFYLNRALLDGYFLSGVSDDKKPTPISSSTAGELYRPFLEGDANNKMGNHRLVGYFREGFWGETSYGKLSSSVNQTKDLVFRYQSVAGDLLIDGAFNINSTSVDAWIAQLSSLRGASVKRAGGGNINSNQTSPIVRYLEEPAEENSWNQFKELSDKEIATLAKAMVKQVKLRGPFLSFSDFVNRRLAPGPENPEKAKGSGQNFVTKKVTEWMNYPENRYTSSGLRGAVQTAIAEAGLNDTAGLTPAGEIPQVPTERWSGSSLKIFDFGLHASSLQELLWPNGSTRYWGAGTTEPGYGPEGLPDWTKYQSAMQRVYGTSTTLKAGATLPNVPSFSRIAGYKFRPDKFSYDTTEFGEAPENFLAVEHLATGANKPGWVMQADLLSPLAPVTSARSDTFTIRVKGESGNEDISSAWIELVVQRTPDYVKSDIDGPHHRPHEPFKDENFNGYWDNGAGEEWIDFNRNGINKAYPDMAGESEAKYRDGMVSDLRLELDPQEENPDIEQTLGVSFLGVNQRFGRKFKIVRFRWLREQDV